MASLDDGDDDADTDTGFRAPKRPPEEDHCESPTQDHTDRHQTDAYLRSVGFRVWRRVHGQPAVWLLNGVEYYEHEAIEIADRLTLAAAPKESAA